MGAWMAIGVAQHFAERLSSLSFGGWNCLEGSAPGFLKAVGKPHLSWDEYMHKAKELSPPGSLEWVTGDVWIALSHCHEQLRDLDGAAKAIIDLEVPILIYSGREDYCHDPMKAFAIEHSLNFLSIPGDHMTAMKDGAPHLLSAINSLATTDRPKMN